MSDWPVDPDGEEGSEGGRKYGHRIVADKIDEDEDFPLRVGAFVEEYGDYPVRIDFETVVSVREVFEPIDDDRTFENFPSLHKALGRAMRDRGYWFYEGAEAFVGTDTA